MSIIKTGLIYFDQAIREGSIRKAADQLNIASSAVSRQLLQLEEELGVELFVRLPRGIRPTSAGEALLGYIRNWNREESQLRQELGRLRGGVHGTIHVACAESVTASILPNVMSQFQKDFPLVDFTLISGDNYFIKESLLSKDADVVCAFDVSGGVRTETVFSKKAPIGVVSPPGHPLSKIDRATLGDCLVHPVVAPTKEWLAHSVLSQLFHNEQASFRIAARVERIGMVKNLVSAGLGIAFMSSVGLEEDIRCGRLVWTPLAHGMVPPTTMSLLIPKGRVLEPHLHHFISVFKATLDVLETQ